MTGRWPANVILSPSMAEVLDGQSGVLKSGGSMHERSHAHNGIYGAPSGERQTRREPDEGGASRYFLTAGYEPWEIEWILANDLVPCGGSVYYGT